MIRRRGCLALAPGFILPGALMACAGARPSPPARISLIGVAIVPYGTLFQGSRIGGLSGIDYDPHTGRYVTISDDRTPDARFYELSLPVSEVDVGAPVFHSVTRLTDRHGRPFEPDRVDPESIRYAPGGGFFWASEGARQRSAAGATGPEIYVMDPTGRETARFPVPEAYAPAMIGGEAVGIRRNEGFESLAVSPDGRTLLAGTERALRQDGAPASPGSGSPARILRYDIASRTLTAEFVYVTEPLPAESLPGSKAADNGLAELLALTETVLLTLERSYAVGLGNTICIFRVDLDGATNVLGRFSLQDAPWTAVRKTLLVDLAQLGITPDDVEGITFGPVLPNGDRTLILVSDDNFDPRQRTQFIALRWSG